MTTILHQCPLCFPESDLSITASEIPVYLLSKLPAHFDPALIFYLHFSNTKFLIFLFYWSLYISELPNILIFHISRPTHVFEQRVRINPFLFKCESHKFSHKKRVAWLSKEKDWKPQESGKWRFIFLIHL